ncbi:MAG: putative metal-binding motif-containing protein [Deltaproteobacteria bacterium]|nr:putative metal-binding motif-containing protein [Deltaproteobacteria bacterium]
MAPLAGGSPNGAHFLSKEASATTGPQLVVEYTITDGDNDTYPDGPDCNDANASIHPGATEQCNSVDDNCDGVIDEGCGTGGAGGSPDASTDAAPDASGTAGKGAGGGTNLHPVNEGEPSDSGCSCRAAGKEAGTGVWVAAMLAGLIAAASARRSGRSRSQSR